MHIFHFVSMYAELNPSFISVCTFVYVYKRSNHQDEETDLRLHLSSLLRIHSQDVLVVADGVLAVFVFGADVPSQGLQDAVGLHRTKKRKKRKKRSG